MTGDVLYLGIVLGGLGFGLLLILLTIPWRQIFPRRPRSEGAQILAELARRAGLDRSQP